MAWLNGINKWMYLPAIMVGHLKIKGPNSYSIAAVNDVNSSYYPSNLLITPNDMDILAQTRSAPAIGGGAKPITTKVVDIAFNTPGTYIIDMSLEVVSPSLAESGYIQLHNFGPYI